MKKILPLAKHPYFQVFSYHTFLNAVILSSIPEDGIATRLEVKDFSSMEWSVQKDNLTEKFMQNHLEFEQNLYATKMNACYYRKAKEYDEVDLDIVFQEYSNPWGAINVFLTTNDQDDMLFDDGYLFRFGNFNRQGVYLRYQGVEKKYEKIKVKYPCGLVLKKEKKKLTVFYREETGALIKVNELGLGNDVDEDNLRIGFEVKLGNSSYYEWLYSNYIQICGNTMNLSKKLDFYGLPYKDWNNYFRNYFIDYNIETQESIKNYGFTFIDFAKKNIDFGRYVETWVNQYHIRGRGEYKRIDHFHQNLIYGYDDETAVLYIMGYNSGKPACFEISYEDFESANNYSERFPLWITYNFSPDYASYHLNVSYVKRMLQEYLHGTNSSQSSAHIVNNIDNIYGILIYDSFLTEQGINGLLEDIRISQLLFEHKRCMRDRIEYMIHCGCMPEWTEELSERMNQIYITSQMLRNLIVKNKIVVIPNVREQVAQFVMKLKVLEEELYPILVEKMIDPN